MLNAGKEMLHELVDLGPMNFALVMAYSMENRMQNRS